MINKALIITHKEDYTSDFLIQKLNERNLNYKRLNCEDLWDKNFKFDNFFQFEFDGSSNYSSIWFRRTKIPKIENVKPEVELYLAHEYDAFLKNLFAILDSKWLSNPFFVYKAENKLLQLKEASKIGFKIPNTVITNSKSKLKKFYSDNNGEIIIKPLSQSRIYSNNVGSFIFSNLLKEQHYSDLESFDLTPCIYQQYIKKKHELRITVVGEEVFAAAVNSQDFEETKIDWRRENLEFYKTSIPKHIEVKCIEIVKKLGLHFGAIDLILDKDDNYVFLEVNPNGQWAWIESQTELPISEAIIKFLFT